MVDDRIFGQYRGETVEVLQATQSRAGRSRVLIRRFYHGGRYKDEWVSPQSLKDVEFLGAEDVVEPHVMAAHRRPWMNRKKRKKNPVSLRSIMAKAMTS